ncbi:unnamed protein product [Rotaria sp. Silwood2]|nr:unnamed protein product [Rotaria sp. Silwood2]CAF4309108.1 unnamed protein product [Rotaria sp. Silwood2]CAF4502863.1 unnamed protein product [Rotaria sp. Silwood2]CAF4673136.1 unnamed protein product [Rotaria sp. Silwood2]
MERNESGFQSRGQMLDYFQAVTCFNFEDSLQFLNQYQWDLNKAIRKFYNENGKVSLIFLFLNNTLLCYALREVGLTNSGNQALTSMLIREKNDEHLANFIGESANDPKIQNDISNLIVMGEIKRIALVAHDNKKTELIECLRSHRDVLAKHKLYGTGTTGSLVEKELKIPVTKFESGPKGGDQQLGAKITARELDILIFFIDPLDSHPHASDVQALLRLTQVYGIVCATTAATVDFILSSAKMDEPHVRKIQTGQTSKPK